MPEENNEGTAPPNNEGAMPTNEENEAETSRAKTPLELVRERQAQLRGHKSDSGHASNERHAASANSYKRRQHQRRAG